MPYEHLEEFLSKGDERVVGTLSLLNIAGVAGGGFFCYQIGLSLGLPSLPVLFVALVGAIAGYVLTVRIKGMSILLRLVWWGRFALHGYLHPPGRVVDMNRLAMKPITRRRPSVIGTEKNKRAWDMQAELLADTIPIVVQGMHASAPQQTIRTGREEEEPSNA